MLSLEQLQEIAIHSPARIVFLIMDGLGGLPHPDTGRTELETARTPNLDRLAREGICGLGDPVGPGITPGSGPGHLALFGYDPVTCNIGRGALEAVGIDVEFRDGDIAARGNFCTIDSSGAVTDRRAGRISTEKGAELVEKLTHIKVDGARAFVYPVKEHRFVLVLRGEGLSPELNDSDPQETGVPPKQIQALDRKAERAARVVNEFVNRAREALAKDHPANMVLLRGFAHRPNLPSVEKIYGLKAGAIAAYPMYRGLARLAGMSVLEHADSIEQEFDILAKHWTEYDFFFLHIKQTDSAGEDGDFNRKVGVIEHVDSLVPRLTGLGPDVVVVSGDHSTPALLASHSWHPVPFLLHSRWCRPDGVAEFGERACARGSLGNFPMQHAMSLAVAYAQKFTKYGA